MLQLDLFEYRPPKQEILLLEGNNFLLLPARKPLFESREVLVMAFIAFAFFMNSISRSETEQKAVLGAFTQPQIEVAAAATEPVTVVPDPVEAKVVIPKPVPAERVYVPVLMYHHVGESPTHNSLDIGLTVSVKDFEEQMAFFKQKGFESVSLAQIYTALTDGAVLPSKPIVFTFDDGYKDVFVNALPILKKYGFVGSFAIAPSLLGANEYATWGEVYLAHQDGMEIVSHSLNHIDFTDPKYSDEFLLQELLGSKLFLESRISTPVDTFVYPYGRYNAQVMELVKQAGYKLALTTELGTEMNLNKAYRLPRVRVHHYDGFNKLRKVLGL